MHDDHLVLRPSHNRMVDDIRLLDTLILRRVLKSLLLNPRNVEDICLRKDFIKRLADLDRDSSPTSVVDDAVRHGERSWGDEVESDGVEGQEGDEAVDCTTIFEVAEESDRLAIDGTQLGSDGVDVEKSLNDQVRNPVLIVWT